MSSEHFRTLTALLAGLIFGIGLALAGMTDPANVIGFLDFAGDWNPSLLFVMGGAVIVALIGFQRILRHKRPMFDVQFHLPHSIHIDRPLIIGAAAFGIGWGLSGYCPGPAIASLSAAGWPLLVFLIASLAGAFIAQKISDARAAANDID